jgi:2-phosphosulfolactate phosphatase
MQPTLNVFALPRYVDPAELAGGTAVVVDVLRAATTIVYALDAGAAEIIPCLEVADALALARQLSTDDVVLGGERAGEPIDGFTLGNSPEEYTPEAVGGKTVIFTTTNGTRALYHARAADEVLIASFVNSGAVARRLFDRQNVHILCAGTDGKISDDDVLLAGMLVERLQRAGGMVYQQNGQAITAREQWLHAFALPHALGAEPLDPDFLAAALRKSLGAQNLLALGLDADIRAASQIDRFDIVPQFDPKTGRIGTRTPMTN